jgi:hypothetical protein
MVLYLVIDELVGLIDVGNSDEFATLEAVDEGSVIARRVLT